MYTYAAIIRKDLGGGKWSQQLQQGWMDCDGNQDEATGIAFNYLKDKNEGASIVDMIVMEVPCECNKKD